MQRVETTGHWSMHRILFGGGIVMFWAIVLLAFALFAADWLLRPATYPVKQISFGGPFKHVSQKELENVALNNLSGSFITADLDAVQVRIAELPWVDRASVSRRWPNAVHVRFSEQKFVAKWGSNSWLNSSGAAVELPQRDGPKDIPNLWGPSGSEQQVWQMYQKLQAKLTSAGLSIEQLELTPRRMWKLKLQSGIDLVIGRKTVEERVERFINVYPFLIKKNRRIRRVDLRYANGLAVAWISGRQTFSRQRIER